MNNFQNTIDQKRVNIIEMPTQLRARVIYDGKGRPSRLQVPALNLRVYCGAVETRNNSETIIGRLEHEYIIYVYVIVYCCVSERECIVYLLYLVPTT